VKLLNVGGPFKVPLFLNIRLRVDENQRVVVCMQNGFFTQQIMPPLFDLLNQTIKFLVIGTIIFLCLRQGFGVVSNGVSSCLSMTPIAYCEASDSISKGWERFDRCKTGDEKRASLS
jgi:hypothetical protein